MKAQNLPHDWLSRDPLPAHPRAAATGFWIPVPVPSQVAILATAANTPRQEPSRDFSDGSILLLRSYLVLYRFRPFSSE